LSWPIVQRSERQALTLALHFYMQAMLHILQASLGSRKERRC
jgi:hypothetical protein